MQAQRLILVAAGLLRAALPQTPGPGAPSDSPTPAPLPPAPALSELLAAAGRPELGNEGVDAVLARLFGVRRQKDWPLAAVFAHASGLDPDEDFWFVADPVTLVVGRNDVRLAAVVDDLVPDETAAMIATLNAHFAEDALVFTAPTAGRWFARSTIAPEIVTFPVAVALGESVRALLPSGADAGKWRRWQDEIQMLLHEHPVNVAREARGQSSVNSIWFWGGGTRPTVERASIRTWADDRTAAALAEYIGVPASPVPASLDAIQNQRVDASTRLVVLDEAVDVNALEWDWVAPAWAALTHEKLGALTLIASDGAATAQWTATPPGIWTRLTLRFRSPTLAASLAAARVAD